MDDIRRPQRDIKPSQPPTSPQNYNVPVRSTVRPTVPPVAPVPPAPAEQPHTPVPPVDLSLSEPPAPKSRRPLLKTILLSIVFVIVAVVGGAAIWYQSALKPVNSASTAKKAFAVAKGQRLSTIAGNLEAAGLIKNQYAFQLYARLSDKSSIPEGTCSLSPAESVSQIASALAAGCHDFKAVTFYPGATIEKPLYKPAGSSVDQDSMYIKYRLSQAGFTDQDITAALGQQYQGALFADKPAGTSLEGYIYGDTYYADPTATAPQVLQMAFDKMYSDITNNDLVAKFQAQGLNLYQGITLSSIVQRELNCEDKPTQERKDRCYGYQQTIAQVFLKRLKEGTTLGSDVTFIYAADMLHIQPSPTIDSPYNTRVHPGLPPGPIASPGLLAMKAVGNPSNTDYNFFIAGDDGLIYFARTPQEHAQNIAEHCKTLCNGM